MTAIYDFLSDPRPQPHPTRYQQPAQPHQLEAPHPPEAPHQLPPAHPAPRAERAARVAAVVHGLSPYYQRIIDGLESGCRRHGIQLLVYVARDGDQRGATFMADMLDGAGLSGIVSLSYPVGGGFNGLDQTARRLGDLPTVVVGTQLPHISSVSCDNAASMTLLMSHLLDEGGVRAPAFVRGADQPDSREREAAFRAACRDRGIAVLESRMLQGGFNRYRAYEATRALVLADPAVDGIVAANDAMAEGALEAVAELGREVPNQVKVTGFDGDARSARTRPPLTTVDQRLHEQGEAAADLVAAQLGGDHQVRTIRLEGRLIVRRSTRPYRALSTRRLPPETASGTRDALFSLVQAEIGPCPPVVDATWARRWLERLSEQLEYGHLDEAWIRSWGKPTGTVDDLERATTWLSGAARVVLDVLWRRLRTVEAGFAAADVHAQVVARLAAVRAEGTRNSDRADLAGQRHLAVMIQALDAAASVPGLLDTMVRYLPEVGVTHCFVVFFDDRLPPATTEPQQGRARIALAYVDGQVQHVDETGHYDLDTLLPSTQADDGPPLVVQPLTAAGVQYGLLLYRQGHVGRSRTGLGGKGQSNVDIDMAELDLPARIESVVARQQALSRADELQGLLVVKTAQLEDEIDSRLKAEDELRRANRELTRSLLIDSLTGIHNRASLDEVLDREFEAHAHSRRSMAVCMVDVDHFKSYNDRYGHLQGDATLRRIAELLRSVARRGADVAARYGGEEFAIVLPDTDQRGAERVARDLLELVRAAAIEHTDAPSARITVSIGSAAVVPSPDWQVADLVRAADTALYQAKAEGRDRAVSGELRPPHEAGSHAAISPARG